MNKKIFNDKVDDIINKLEDNTKLKFIKIKEIFLKYYDFDRLDDINIFSNIRNNGIYFEWNFNECQVILDCEYNDNFIPLEEYNKDNSVITISNIKINFAEIKLLNNVLLDKYKKSGWKKHE